MSCTTQQALVAAIVEATFSGILCFWPDRVPTYHVAFGLSLGVLTVQAGQPRCCGRKEYKLFGHHHSKYPTTPFAFWVRPPRDRGRVPSTHRQATPRPISRSPSCSNGCPHSERTHCHHAAPGRRLFTPSPLPATAFPARLSTAHHAFIATFAPSASASHAPP